MVSYFIPHAHSRRDSLMISYSELGRSRHSTKTTDQRMIAPVVLMEYMAEMYGRLGGEVSCYEASLFVLWCSRNMIS